MTLKKGRNNQNVLLLFLFFIAMFSFYLSIFQYFWSMYFCFQFIAAFLFLRFCFLVKEVKLMIVDTIKMSDCID